MLQFQGFAFNLHWNDWERESPGPYIKSKGKIKKPSLKFYAIVKLQSQGSGKFSCQLCRFR